MTILLYEPAARKRADVPAMDGASCCDYIVFSAFQWTRVMSPYQFLGEDDSVAEWFGRCLDLHGGIGRNVPAAA